MAVRVIVACVLVVVIGRALPCAAEPAGDAVALLPLDAERSLEIYGQPVASELARALVSGGIQVVVVGPRTAVPERARLIIDGTIALGKASAVTIALRLRNPLDGVILETLSATAPGLAKIDGAAAELSTRILPLVRDRLARRAPPPDDSRPGDARKPAGDRPVVIAVSDDQRGAGAAVLAGAFDTVLPEWARAHHRRLSRVTAKQLAPRFARAQPGATGATDELAISLAILDYTAEPGKVAMARARVRVQIAGGPGAAFDRVVATDTVIGDAGLGPHELAARVAREVLAILRPHLRRSVPAW